MATATYTPHTTPTQPGRSILTGLSLAVAIAAGALSVVAIATDDVAQPTVAPVTADQTQARSRAIDVPTSRVVVVAPAVAVPVVAGDPERCELARIGFVDRC